MILFKKLGMSSRNADNEYEYPNAIYPLCILIHEVILRRILWVTRIKYKEWSDNCKSV